MSEEIMTVQPDAAVEVVDIQFRPGQKVYYFDPAGMKLTAGDHVIMDTARGPEFGICTGGNHRIAQKDVVLPLRPVLRKANEWDERTVGVSSPTKFHAVTCASHIARKRQTARSRCADSKMHAKVRIYV